MGPNLYRVSREKDHTAAYKIFHYKWRCQIQEMYLYSDAFMEVAGVVTTGDAEQDRAIARAFIDVNLTIAGMLEYYAEGATIKFVDPKKTKAIYEIITEHLSSWKRITEVSLNQPHVPMDELRLMDEFAAELYPNASRFFQRPHTTSKLLRSLDELGVGRGMSRPQMSISAKQDIEPQQPTDRPGHTPVADAIARHYKRR